MNKTKQSIEDLRQYAADHQRMVEKVKADNPGLPAVTAIVMAGDLLSAEYADKALAAGEPFDRVRYRVGSYARLEWTVEKEKEGYLSEDDLLDMWPGLWSGTDPDDRDPRWLALWRKAYWRNGGIVLDGDPLPGTGEWLTVYRGQMSDDPVTPGIAWSLKREVAEAFAKGAGFRTRMRNGVILTGRVRRDAVLGYLTERGEAEVVTDSTQVVEREVL